MKTEIELMREELNQLRERIAVLEMYQRTHYAPPIIGPNPQWIPRTQDPLQYPYTITCNTEYKPQQ